MIQTIQELLNQYITPNYGEVATTTLTILGISVVAIILYFLTVWFLRLFEKLILKSSTSWDDDMLNPAFLRAVSQLVPAIFVRAMLLGFFSDSSSIQWLHIATSLYIIVTVVRIIFISINNLYAAFLKRPKLHPFAVKGIFQMVQLVVVGVAVIYSISIIIDRSPTTILTALGASAAVLMLVFKDTILGLVASVQLSANKMIHRGDWIVVEGHDANGEVIDISLTTIKVRNWDNSITTIPPYILVSESFRNYQPMFRSGGRRVERSVLIDTNTIRFLSSKEINSLNEKGWLDGLDLDLNAQHINLRLLRLYLEKWLKSDERVNHNMTCMVRQLKPTAAGLPLQLYFFCNEVRWIQFEAIQSDIFDLVYAIIGEFGLRLYQHPAGNDLTELVKK